jgi:hypothetical protein
LTVVEGGGRCVVERLVPPPIVVKVEIFGQGAPGVTRACLLFQVHFFILDRAPEALGENVI